MHTVVSLHLEADKLSHSTVLLVLVVDVVNVVIVVRVVDAVATVVVNEVVGGGVVAVDVADVVVQSSCLT